VSFGAQEEVRQARNAQASAETALRQALQREAQAQIAAARASNEATGATATADALRVQLERARRAETKLVDAQDAQGRAEAALRAAEDTSRALRQELVV
jgi:hypothetical protein